MVNNVEKYFKNSLNIGNAFQGNNANTNSKNSYSVVTFLKDNIFLFSLYLYL